jgi:dCMP deaminase
VSEHWHQRYLDLAERVGAWSKDPSHKVGAIIVRPDKSVASLGFNGLPRGVADTDERLNDRSVKYQMVVHAEVNAILSARENLAGCTIYVSPLHPCSNCAAAIIQAGITTVIARMGTPVDRWRENFDIARRMFDEAGVLVRIMPLLVRSRDVTVEDDGT